MTTYRAAFLVFADLLQDNGWTLKTHHNGKPLKTRHATSPCGRWRLWFHPQSIYVGRADSPAGDARTLTYGDLRQVSPAAFLSLVEQHTHDLGALP